MPGQQPSGFGQVAGFERKLHCAGGAVQPARRNGQFERRCLNQNPRPEGQGSGESRHQPAGANCQAEAGNQDESAKGQFCESVPARTETQQERNQAPHPGRGVETVGRVAEEKVEEAGEHQAHQ